MIVESRVKVLMLLGAMAVQGAGMAAAQPASPAQPGYTLSVTKDEPVFVTLKAKDAKLSDIAADLGKRLNAKVIVGASLKDEKITAEFAGTSVEAAMLALAPRVFIDSEVRRDAQPRALGIYLLGSEDIDPAITAVVQGTSQGLLVQGHTEDTGEPKPDAPLRIKYAAGRLSVFAKEQPLLVVVMAVAEELGIPAEIKYETREVINADVKETAVIEDVFTSFSENVRVYVRSNPTRVEKTILRVVVVPPAAK